MSQAGRALSAPYLTLLRLVLLRSTVSTRIAVTLEQLGKLRDVEGIEARFSNRHIALSVFAFDDDMIVTPHLSNLVGHESPAMHLRRCQSDGMFDRFAMHVNALWDEGRDVWAGE